MVAKKSTGIDVEQNYVTVTLYIKLFESLNPVLSNRPEKLVRFVVVRVDYDRFNRVCIRRTGNRTSHAVAQRGQFFYRGQAPLPPPLTPALVHVQLFQKIHDGDFHTW